MQLNLNDTIQLLRYKSYNGDQAIGMLKKIVEKLRPPRGNVAAINERLTALRLTFNDDPRLEKAFFELCGTIIIESNLTQLLSESGIVSASTFMQQVRRIINNKVLQPLKNYDAIIDILRDVFYKSRDMVWVEAIEDDHLDYFTLGINKNIQGRSNDILLEVVNAGKIVSYRIAALGLDEEIAMRAKKKEELLSPFIEQNRLFIQYAHAAQPMQRQEYFLQFQLQLTLCEESLNQLEKNITETGTSIHQTFTMRRLKQLCQRLIFIAGLVDHGFEKDVKHVGKFFKQVIRNNRNTTDLSQFLNNNLNIVAYRIVEHKKRVGENYITTTLKQYSRIFLLSSGAGFIVSIMVILKFLIGASKLPVFWEGILFSLNYMWGFVAIQLLGLTLASKQPAMTANAIASSLKGSRGNSMVELAILVSKVSRSQFISVIGNLITVIPATFAWLYLYKEYIGLQLVPAEKAKKMLYDNHLFDSPSLIYAAIAGLFLFLSGIVSGLVDNRVVYAKIPERIKQSLFFKKVIPKSKMNAFSELTERSFGAVMGAITLAFFLGMSTFVGSITGLYFDIRHVTFAGGNVMMGWFSSPTADLFYVLMCFITVIGIGMVNILVSFLLALYLALKARGVRLNDYPEIGRILFRHFVLNTKEFFYPPKKGTSAFTRNNPIKQVIDEVDTVA
jgi:site-specific recombinase